MKSNMKIVYESKRKKFPFNFCKVYDIKYDKNGYPHFLIYKNKQWTIISAKNFEPFKIKE